MVMDTVSGLRVDVLNPKIEDYSLEDVAWSLALQCRFNGHVSRHYSVLQHQLEGLQYFSNTREKLQFLFHDSAEAYIGDIISPVKNLPGIKEVIKALETKHLVLLSKKFGFDFPFCESIHTIDKHILNLEWRYLQLKEDTGHKFKEYSCTEELTQGLFEEN